MQTNNDYVSLETAKLLKEAGYDNFFAKTLSQSLVLAYLWDCQKWLREEHKTDITIHRSFSMHNSYHYCIIIDCDYDNEMQQFCEPDRTYESALDSAIQEACKIILSLEQKRTKFKSKP